MILKYADGVDPFRGEVIGGVYQRYAAGEQMISTKKNDRYPYALQWQRASTLIGLTRYWRMLSAAEQTAWNTFAATYPQPTQWNPARFLNGYNLFCRWNFFNRLVNGQAAPILTTPAMSTVADAVLTPTITNNLGSLILNASWSRSGSDIWSAVFISRIVSAGSYYIASQPRFITGIANGGGLEIKLGFLYNGYVFRNASPPIASGWHLTTYTETNSMSLYLGGNTIAGGPMKTSGLDFWSAPNTGATNTSGFSAKASGFRIYNTGAFTGLLAAFYMWNYYYGSGTSEMAFILQNTSASITNSARNMKQGCSIRAIKDSTTLSEGQSGVYTGIDNKIYNTIVINGKEILTQNLAETKFRDGSNITEVPDAATWSSLLTPGRCSYENDINNAFVASPSAFDISEPYFNMFGRLPLAGEKVLVKVIKFNKVSGQFLPEQEFFLDVL